jgi:hypothetical protein
VAPGIFLAGDRQLLSVRGADWPTLPRNPTDEAPPTRHRQVKQDMHDVDQLREELRALVGSWEYAFAMGHGCSIGAHPDHRAIRQRAADLRARIAELTH